MGSVKRQTGPRRRTSRAAIVAAAVSIVDQHGAEALTIRRVASACGLSPMGIYRYLRDRDELLDLVVQHALEELPRRAPTGTWQAKATRLFGDFRRMALRHPGITALGVARATPVAAMARFTDRALSIMEEAGFRGPEVVLAYDALLMFTIGSIVWQVPRTGRERARLLPAAEAVGAAATHLAHHASALAARDPDRYFRFGLRIVLAGLAASRAGRADAPASRRT